MGYFVALSLGRLLLFALLLGSLCCEAGSWLLLLGCMGLWSSLLLLLFAAGRENAVGGSPPPPLPSFRTTLRRRSLHFGRL